MRQHTFYRTAWIFAGIAVLSGCSSTFEAQQQADHERVLERTRAAQQQLQASEPARGSLVSENTLRFARKSVPFDAGQMLPAHIQTVTMKSAGLHDLKSVAQWIEELTRLPVSVSPDALLPASSFALESSDNQAGADQKQASETEADGQRFSIHYHGPLKGLLDQVAARAQVRWAFQAGSIRFYRVISRSIAVRSLPGNLTQSGGVQLSSGMSTSSEMDMNVWQGIEKTLEQMLSRQGRLRVDPGLGLVTVRDAAPHVEAVEQFLDGINRQLARQVTLSVEVLQISLNNRFEAGIDWNYVRNVVGMGTFTAGGLPSVAGATANMGFIRASETGATSTVLIKALETFGRVSTAYSSVVNTLNRQPVPVGSINTRSYLRQITPNSASNTNGTISYGPPGLTPGEIVTGFNMTLLPIVLDSNMVLVQCGLSISALREIVAFSSGTGLAQQTVQQPNVSSFMTLQRMAVRTGDTIVLSGFDSEATESKQNDIRRNEIPGTRASARDKTTMVILITPRLLEF